MGRLKSGVDLQQAQVGLRLHAGRLEQLHSQTNEGWTVTLFPSREARFWPAHRKSIIFFLAILSASSLFVLLLGCANVGNFLLARASSRRTEIGIRMALGASRTRLLRQLLIEGGILSILGM
ncbi:MAG: FtsX-like permease family protein, partial [Planctomycetaceae bacterium]